MGVLFRSGWPAGLPQGRQSLSFGSLTGFVSGVCYSLIEGQRRNQV